jgi:large subunit ribosomal protein L22
MQFVAKAKNVWYSPFKLRPLIDVVRGKDVNYALNWLKVQRSQRVEPIKKTLESAIANAYHLQNIDAEGLRVKEIRVDEAAKHKYFKPAAMGRAMVYRKRLSHINVVLESK